MAPRSGFVFIPSRTKDLRTACARRLWGSGVGVASGLSAIWLQAVTSDGAGGIYVLSVQRTLAGADDLIVSHVDTAGVMRASTTVASIGFASSVHAHVVPSAGGSCIVVWSFSHLGDQLLAQRFDRQCQPLWAAPSVLLPTAAPSTYAMTGASVDGGGGAVVSALRAGQDFLVQRVDATGQSVWTQAISLPSLPPVPAKEASQVVYTGTGFLVLFQLPAVQGDPAPNHRNTFGQWLHLDGSVNGPEFSIGPVGRERWFFRAGTARAISEASGSAWVAISPTSGPLQLMRFQTGGTIPQASNVSRPLADGATYSLAPDGFGGIVVATIDPTLAVGVDRFDDAGQMLWTATGPSRVAVVANLPQSNVDLPLAHRAVAIACRDGASYLIAFQHAPVAGQSRILFRCLDVNGNPIGVPATDLTTGAGVETAVLLTQPQLTQSSGDSGNVIAAWHTDAAAQTQSLSVQKLGCCREVYDVDRVPDPWSYGCAIPIDYSPAQPGTITASFPCSRGEIGSFGVLPIPHLATVPGITIPGALLNTRVAPPAWARLEFSGIPSDVQVFLYSHTGVRIGTAKPVGGSRGDSTIRALTFRPQAKLSYALAFVRPTGIEAAAPITFGLDVSFGEGRPTATGQEVPPSGKRHAPIPRARGKRRTATPRGRR